QIGRNTIDAVTRDSSLVVSIEGNVNAEVETELSFTGSQQEVGLRTNMLLDVPGNFTRSNKLWIVRG
ncbi:hypothetical protein ACFLRC_02695, partial [Candidatus Altiarchaeota archaeon]